jgi:hypothetical protein
VALTAQQRAAKRARLSPDLLAKATTLQPGFHYNDSGNAQHALTDRQVRLLAKKYGLPPAAMSQISKGESNRDFRVQQKDPGDGMVGFGGFQLTPNAWGEDSAAMRRFLELGGIEGMKDIENQFKMARFLYKSAGNSLDPWYGTRYLTDTSGVGSLGPVRKGMEVPGLSAAAPGPGGAPGKMTLERGTETFDVADPDAQRKIFFANWLAEHQPNSPLLKFGIVSPNIPTTKQVSMPTTTGFKITPGQGPGAPKGGRPGPVGQGPEKAVAAAIKRLGVSESNGSNRGTTLDKWQQQYGMLGQPWCGIFVGLVLEKAGVKGIGSDVASTAAIEANGKAGRGGFKSWHSPQQAQVGDALLIRPGGSNGHVGLVVGVDRKKGLIHTIEGNTGDGTVARRTHSMSSVHGAARPRWKG